jgi:hypothetical protein
MIFMRYLDGREVRLGDRVKLWEDAYGVVVCSIDTDEYTTDYPKEAWGYLGEGVLIPSDVAGLTHYTQPDEDLELIERASS